MPQANNIDTPSTKRLDLKDLKGCWALVTGASAGIGKEFSIQLAQAGVNLVLVARRENLLQSLANQLRHDYHIDCVIIPTDLGQGHAADTIKNILNEKEIKIRLLVNNAGLNFYGQFAQMPQPLAEQVMHVNAIAVCELCTAFLNDLRAYPTSGIINISSQAALNPLPGAAVYAATKAFVHSLSLSLYEELKNTPIHVQTLIPGTTETESTQQSNALFKKITQWGNCQDLVHQSLARLRTGEPIVTTAKGLYIQKLFVNLMPIKIVLRKLAAMFVK